MCTSSVSMRLDGDAVGEGGVAVVSMIARYEVLVTRRALLDVDDGRDGRSLKACLLSQPQSQHTSSCGHKAQGRYRRRRWRLRDVQGDMATRIFDAVGYRFGETQGAYLRRMRASLLSIAT